MSVSPEEPPLKKKRNRIPLSCTQCRARKKKCDRRRPVCSYCAEHGGFVNCHYEVDIPVTQTPFEAQEQSNSLEVESLQSEISDLKRQLEQMREALSYNANGSNGIVNQSSYNPDDRSRAMVLYLRTQFDIHGNDDVPSINRSETLKIFSNGARLMAVRTNSLLLCSPLKKMSIMINDTIYKYPSYHLNCIYRYVKQVLKEHQIESDYTILVAPLPDKLNESFKVIKLISIVKNCFDVENPYYIDSLKYLTALLVTRYGEARPVIGERFENNEANRTSLINEVQEILPKNPQVIKYLWLIFEKFVYPFIPIFDLFQFKKDIEMTIMGLSLNVSSIDDVWNFANTNTFGDSNDVNYVISLTSFMDLSLIASFLIILRTAYVALKVHLIPNFSNNEIEKRILNIENLNYISPSFISLAMSCLNQAKAFRKFSITSLNTILLLQYYYVNSEEISGCINNNEISIMSSSSFSMAVGLGLERDWSSIAFFDFQSHPGVDFVDKQKLLYLTRKIWHTMQTFSCDVFVSDGEPFLKTSQLVQLPKYPISDPYDGNRDVNIRTLNGLRVSEELQLNALIDNNYIIQKELSEIFIKFSDLINGTNDTSFLEVYRCYTKLGKFITLRYSEQVNYFLNNDNFKILRLENEQFSNLPINQNTFRNDNAKVILLNSDYLIMLNKIYQFANYTSALTLRIKLASIFILHCENTKNLSLYIFFLKDMTSFVSIVVELFINNYSLNNDKFLKMENNEQFKCWNHKLMPKVATSICFVGHFCLGFLYRLFICIFIIKNKIKEFEDIGNLSHLQNIKNMNEQVSRLIILKESMMQSCISMFKGYFHQTLRVVYGDLKQGLVFAVNMLELISLDESLKEKNYLGEFLCSNLFFKYPKLNEPSLKQTKKFLDLEYEIFPIPLDCFLLQCNSKEIFELQEILNSSMIKDLNNNKKNLNKLTPIEKMKKYHELGIKNIFEKIDKNVLCNIFKKNISWLALINNVLKERKSL